MFFLTNNHSHLVELLLKLIFIVGLFGGVEVAGDGVSDVRTFAHLMIEIGK